MKHIKIKDASTIETKPKTIDYNRNYRLSLNALGHHGKIVLIRLHALEDFQKCQQKQHPAQEQTAQHYRALSKNTGG